MMKALNVGILLMLGILSCPMSGRSQTHERSARRQNSTAHLVKQYEDSLKTYGEQLYDSTSQARERLTPQATAPLFLPMTFYKDVTHKAFSIDGTLTPVDEQLLSVYLRHPEWVVNTQSRLEKTGTVLQPSTVVQKPTVEVVKAKPQEPEVMPVDVIVWKPNFWTFKGDYYLQFLQNYISGNWYKGGESNYSMVGSVTLEANYNNKSKLKWDNKLELKLGFQTTKSDTLHNLKTSDDLMRYTGKLGLQATKKWYYTVQVLAYTQFMRNYKTNQDVVQSDFMSPFNLNLSVGMDYTVEWLNKQLTGTIHLAPVAYNLKYVGRLDLATRYGLEEGKHTLHDLGSLFTVDLKWKIMENLNWQTRLYGYTTYSRCEFEWENTFTFQFNKFISTKVFVFPRFDDGADRDDKHGYWQFKEFVSLGFSYSF
jgi:hypothetical protein